MTCADINRAMEESYKTMCCDLSCHAVVIRTGWWKIKVYILGKIAMHYLLRIIIVI